MNKNFIIGLTFASVGICCGYALSRGATHPETGIMPDEVDIVPMFSRDNERFLDGEGTRTLARTRVRDDRDLWGLIVRLQGKVTAEQLRQEFLNLIGQTHLLKTSGRWDVNALLLICEKWAEMAPRQVLGEIAGHEGHISDILRARVFKKWASINPEECGAYYRENRSCFYGSEKIVGSIVHQWASSSPEDAWKWLHSLNNKEIETGIGDFFTGLSQTRSTEMGKYVSYLSETEKTNILLVESVASDWAKVDLEAAREWVANLPEEQGNDARGEILSEWASQDLAGATEEFARLPEERQEMAADKIVRRLISEEGYGVALDWALNNTPPHVAQSIFSNKAMQAWINENPPQARLWIDNLPPGPLRDTAITTYVWENASPAHDENMVLVGTMSNPDERIHVEAVELKNWYEVDKAGALNWLEHSNHTESRKAELREKVSAPPLSFI